MNRRDYKQGKMNDYEYYSDQTINIVSLFGDFGAVFGIGWSLGHIIANTDLYQKMKFNFYYNYWENNYGKPSDYNKELWEYFYKNYRP